jgi:transketolase
MSSSDQNLSNQSIDDLAINCIRTLAMDAVQSADSGHPGTPMALAPIAYELWARRLVYDPANPLWPNRDRYVLSCGHASMLLYALIHLSGIRHCDRDGQVTNEPALSLEALKNFRQWDSRTPGHPEYSHTTGVETTTGPFAATASGWPWPASGSALGTTGQVLSCSTTTCLCSAATGT